MAFHLFQVGNFPHFSPNISGYELLKSKGLELISDDSIRQRISILYENHYKYIATWEDERIYHNTVHLYPLRNKHQAQTSLSIDFKPASLARNNYFDMITDYGGVREILDFENLLNDTELLGLVKDIGVYARFNLEVHQTVQSEVKAVIAEIEKELN